MTSSKRYGNRGPKVPKIKRGAVKRPKKRSTSSGPIAPEITISATFQQVRSGLPTKQEKARLGDFKILMIDIETAPNLVYTWGLWDQNVGLNQLVKPSYTLCFAAKFYGASNDEIHFHASWAGGEYQMIKAAHALMNEADAIVTQNGNKFDIPILNRDFLRYKMGPPSPSKSIDLLRVSRNRFRFASSKLDHISKELGFGSKIETEGFPLWTKVMAGDTAAQERMREYNIQDVLLLEPLYREYRPWVKGHPNLGAFLAAEGPICGTCGSEDLQAQGYALLDTKRRAQYVCKSCGTWIRERTDKDAMPRARTAF